MRALNSRMNSASLARQFVGQRNGTVAEAQFFSCVERVTPMRAPNIEADALVPAAQCLIIGVGTFAITAPLAIWAFDWPVGAIVGTVFAGIGTGAMALNAVSEARRSLYAVETLKDNLAAQSIASQEASVEAMTVDLTVRREDLSETNPPLQRRILPVDDEQFRLIAEAAIEGQPLTQADWAGADKPLSRTQFDVTMDYLTALGVLAWKSARDHAQGRAVTHGGRAALRAWIEGRAQLTHASTHASSTPLDDDEGEELE